MQQRAFLFSILECLHRVVYCCIEVCSLDKPLGIDPLPSLTDGLFLLSCRQRGRTAYIYICSFGETKWKASVEIHPQITNK